MTNPDPKTVLQIGQRVLCKPLGIYSTIEGVSVIAEISGSVKILGYVLDDISTPYSWEADQLEVCSAGSDEKNEDSQKIKRSLARSVGLILSLRKIFVDMAYGSDDRIYSTVVMIDGYLNDIDGSTARHSLSDLKGGTDDKEKQQMLEIKDLGVEFIQKLHSIGGTKPDAPSFGSRDLSLANTHIEDAVMRAVRHITS